MKIDPDHLDAIEALATSATPGPWRHGNVEKYHVFSPCAESLGPERVLLRMNEHFAYANDAGYIAAVSPDVVLALVAEVRAYRRSAAVADESTLRVLATAALQEFPDTEIPRWIADLSEGPDTNQHVHDRARWAGLIAWAGNTWRLTGPGWQTLNNARK